METKNLETVTGRGGLLIPIIEFDDSKVPDWKFLNFFHNLWELNGYKAEGEYNNEIVVPPSRDKSLLVIRGANLKTSELDWVIESRKKTDWGYPKISYSHEEHKILTPPEKAASFITHLALSYTHKSESGEYPRLTVDNENITDWTFCAMDDPEIQGLPFVEQQDMRSQKFQDGIKAIMAETVELLT